MPSLNKTHAEAIAKKLGAVIDKSAKAHDIANVFHYKKLIAKFGIRRGSNRDQGHAHIPRGLHLSPRQTLLLAQCTFSVVQWLEVLREGGWLLEED